MVTGVRFAPAARIGLLWALTLTVSIGLFAQSNKLRDFIDLLSASVAPDDMVRTSPEIFYAYAVSPNFILAIGQFLASLFQTNDAAGLHYLFLTLFVIEACALSCGIALALARFTSDARFIWVGLALASFSAIGVYGKIRPLNDLVDGTSIGLLATSFNILSVGLFLAHRRLAAVLVSVACMNIHVINGGLGLALICAVESQQLLISSSYRRHFILRFRESLKEPAVIIGSLVILALILPIAYRLVTAPLPSTPTTSDFLNMMLHRTSLLHPLRDGILVTSTPFFLVFFLIWVRRNTPSIDPESFRVAFCFATAVIGFLVFQIVISDFVFVPRLATIQWHRTMGTLQLMLLCILVAHISSKATATPLGWWVPFTMLLCIVGIRAPHWLGVFTLTISGDPNGMYADYLLILCFLICGLLASSRSDFLRKLLIVFLPVGAMVIALFALHVAALSQLACTEPASRLGCMTDLFIAGRKIAQPWPEALAIVMLATWWGVHKYWGSLRSPAILSAIVAATVATSVLMAWVMANRYKIPQMIAAKNPFYDWSAWTQQNRVGEAVAKATPRDAVVFSPHILNLVTYRRQYFDAPYVIAKMYSSPNTVADDVKRLAALGIYFDDRSPAREACAGGVAYLTFRCMFVWPSFYMRPRQADWRARLANMKAVEPKLSAVVISRGDVKEGDVVLGQVNDLAIVDVQGRQ
jgi:hypothetical protein